MLSKEYKTEEVRSMFLNYMWRLIDYWTTVDLEDRNFKNKTEEISYRLSGLMHSMLVTLDGGSVNLPAFIVAPRPHESDKEYNQCNNKNWFPENHKIGNKIKGDISGWLHEMLYNNRKK